MKRVVIIFVLLIAGLSFGLWFKVRELRAAEEAPTGSSGVIEGVEADVSARLPARILEITVREGDAVKKGQALVKLDCREQQAVLAAARARLRSATISAAAARAQVGVALGSARAAAATVGAAGARSKALLATRDLTSRQAKRIEKLQGAGGATEMELDRASSQLKQLNRQLTALRSQLHAARGQAAAARARAKAAGKQAEAAAAAIEGARADVRRAQTLVDECTLRSPLAGVVLTRAYEPGELVFLGAKVLTVVQLARVETTFYVPNRELAAAEVGRQVTVSADAYPGKSFKGTIRSVSAKAEFTARNVQTRRDRDRLVYAVRVEIDNPVRELRPGMPVEVRIDGTGGGQR